MARPAEEGFNVFRGDGSAASLDEIKAAMSDVDVVFVGEEHDDPAAHTVEAKILAAAYEVGTASARDRRPVALGLEMFERDVQTALDEYLTGLVTEQQFLKSSRPWSNYATDYKPLVEFAREHKLAVIAANAPERYVNRVGRLGRDSLGALSKEAKAWLPRLPYGEPGQVYADKFRRTMSDLGANHGPAQQSGGMSLTPERLTRMLDGQSLRDATMADSIARYLGTQRNALVVHVNGSFHSTGGLGIPEHLKRYRSKARVLVVTVVPSETYPNFDSRKHERVGDFVIVTDPSLPRATKN